MARQRGRVCADSSEQLPGRVAVPRCGGGRRLLETTWALVPPMPKELTPARRGAAVAAAQSRARAR